MFNSNCAIILSSFSDTFCREVVLRTTTLGEYISEGVSPMTNVLS